MPPPIAAMDNDYRDRKVIIHLSDVDAEEPIPERIITLRHPNWSAELGRGSLSDELIVPGPANGWFNSKVMSRQHAALKADPEAMLITLGDTGSMHGTYLNGEKITGKVVELLQNDIITFGTDVVRQTETFAPLKTQVTYEWSTIDAPATAENAPNKTDDQLIKNSFTAVFDEDDDCSSDFEDDVEIVQESVIRQPSVEIIEPSRQPFVTLSPSTSSSTRFDERRDSDSSALTSSPSVQTGKKSAPVPHVGAYVVDAVEVDSASDPDLLDHQSEHDSESVSDRCTEVPEPFEYEDDNDDEKADSIISVEDDFEHTKFSSDLHVVKEMAVRQPSPSDAAMAKTRPKTPPRAPSVAAAVDISIPPSAPFHESDRSSQSQPSGHESQPLSYHTGHFSTSYANPFTRMEMLESHPLHQPYNLDLLSPPFGSHLQLPLNHHTSRPSYYSAGYQDIENSTAPYAENAFPPAQSGPETAMYDTIPPSLYHSANSDSKLHSSSPKRTKRTAAQISNDTSSTYVSYSPRPAFNASNNAADSLPDHSIQPQSDLQSLPASSTAQCKSTHHAPVANVGDLTTRTLGEMTTDPAELESANVAVTDPSHTIHQELVQTMIEGGEEVEGGEGEEAEIKEPAEPARKKIRTSDGEMELQTERTGSIMKTAARYTATALAGATVGAFGVVLGLASLPPDYFA